MARVKRAESRNTIALMLGSVYALFYLYSIGDLTIYGPPAWGGYINNLSWERIFSARALFQFEGVAVLEMGYLVWLVSPINMFFALLLSGLLAANVHGALYLRAQPGSCRADHGTLAGAFPAMLAGGACCAPSLLILLGMPSLGAVSAYFGWLIPVSLSVLMLNRLWQGWRGAPKLFAWPWQSSQ